MKDKKRYKTLKYLIYFAIGFLFGLYKILNQEKLNYTGWFIMAVSFFFLSSFFEQKDLNIKQKRVLIVLSYIVAAGLFIFWLAKTYG